MASKKKASPHGAQLKAFLADPNKRASLPTKLLSPTQQKARALNQRLNAPVLPGSSLTNRDLSHEATAAVAEKYGPQQSALKTFQNNVGSWYDGYQAELRKAATAQQQSGVALQGELANLNAGMGAADSAAQGAGDQAAQQSAAVRGTSVDPGIAARGQQATQVNSGLNQAFGALAATQGAARDAQASNMAEVVAPQAKIAAQSGVAQQLAALGAQMGAYKTEYKGQRLTDEQKNLIANQALGLNVTRANAAAALGKGRLGVSTAAEKLAEKKAADAAARDAYQRKTHTGPYKPAAAKTPKKVKPTSGPGSRTPTDESRIAQHVRTLEGLISTAPTTDKNGKPLDVKASLVSGAYPHGSPNDPLMVALAFDLHANDGKLSSHGIDLVHQLGLHASQFQKAPTKAAKVVAKAGKGYAGL